MPVVVAVETTLEMATGAFLQAGLAVAELALRTTERRLAQGFQTRAVVAVADQTTEIPVLGVPVLWFFVTPVLFNTSLAAR
jgi:hypothetical protein